MEILENVKDNAQSQESKVYFDLSTKLASFKDYQAWFVINRSKNKRAQSDKGGIQNMNKENEEWMS